MKRKKTLAAVGSPTGGIQKGFGHQKPEGLEKVGEGARGLDAAQEYVDFGEGWPSEKEG